MAKNFRSIFRFLLPSWLTTGEGEKVWTAITTVIDDNVALTRASLEARFPSRAGDDALVLIGQDRGIPRGRTETSAHYVQRLIAWRYPRGHVVRGSAFAALTQISEYFGGIACFSIDVRGNRHDHAANGDESFSYGNAWNWDGTTTPKGRFWFVIFPAGQMSPQRSFGDPLLYGGALGSSSESVGQLGATPDDAKAIRDLFRGSLPWKPAGTMQQWLIVNLDGTTQTPDATWAHWSKNVSGTQVRSRYAGWRYWALDPALNRYAGNPANYPTAYTRTGGGTYSGNPAAFPAAIQLSRVGIYAGNPANYPATIQLLDDGSSP